MPCAHNDPAIDVALNADSTGNVHAQRMFIAQSPQLQKVRVRLSRNGPQRRPPATAAFLLQKRRLPTRLPATQTTVRNALGGGPHSPELTPSSRSVFRPY